MNPNNHHRRRKTNGRYYSNDGNDTEDDSTTHASMANAVVDMVLNQDDNDEKQQQHQQQYENGDEHLAQRQRCDQISVRGKNTTRTSSTRKVAAHIKKNHKKIHPLMPNTTTTTTTSKQTPMTSKSRRRQEEQQQKRSQSYNNIRLNLVDMDIDDPSLDEEKVGVSYHSNTSSLHKITSDEEKMLQEKIAGILVATNKDIPNGKEQLSPLYYGDEEKASSPSRSTSAPPDILRRKLAGAALDEDDDNDMIPPSLRRHAQSLPGAVRIRGPGYVEDDSPDDTNSILSQIVASVTHAATRSESERVPNNENDNNNNDGDKSSDGSESDEENLINAVLVDTDDFVEATIMPEPRKRKCRNILCGLMVFGMAVVLAGLLPMIYEKLEKGGETLSSSDAVNVESDKDIGDDESSAAQTLSPSQIGTAQEKFVTDVDTMSPTTTPAPTASPSKVPTSVPTTSQPTSLPSITPTTSPTVSVTITVVIQLDDHPEQTGWSLKCDGQTYFHIPPMTYENDVNRQIVVLGQTYSGANCELGIVDTGFDGIADGSYEVYYGNDITDPAYRLVDGWGSSFERDLKVPFVVAAPPTMSPTTSLAPTQSPAPSVQPGLGLPAINMVPVTVEIQLDYFAAEISWALQCGDETVASYAAGSYTTANALVRETYEIQEGKECRFGILDKYGDGICCVYGNGYYSINVGNDFTNEDNVIVYGTLYVGVGQREESFTVMEPINSGSLFKSLP